MIETEYFILEEEQYLECIQDAAIEGVQIDYYLMEFCDITGEDVYV